MKIENVNQWFSSWDIDGKGLTVIGNRLTGKHICNAKNEDDAAYLTKCLNAHDELVEHLKNVLWNFEAHKDELTPVQRGCINQIAKTINSLPK